MSNKHFLKINPNISSISNFDYLIELLATQVKVNSGNVEK